MNKLKVLCNAPGFDTMLLVFVAAFVIGAGTWVWLSLRAHKSELKLSEVK